MKSNTLSLAMVTVLGLSASQAAFSAGTPKFDEIDANKDGKISKQEAANVAGLDFAAADSNHDGVLTKSEYEAATS